MFFVLSEHLNTGVDIADNNLWKERLLLSVNLKK